VTGKYFKTRYRPAGILRNINAMIYFKFKLQFRNKTYSSVIVNFHTVLCSKHTNRKLKFGNMKNKSFHEKGPLTFHCHLSLASATKAAPYRCHFVQAFEIALLSIRSVQNALIILILFLQMVWLVKFTRPNSRHFSFNPSPHPSPIPHFLFPILLSLFLRHSAPCVGDYSHAITLPVSCYLQEQKS
jgi:hypothetical protein